MGMLLLIKKIKNRCSDISSEAFWSYKWSVLKGKSTQPDSVLFGV